MNSDREASLTLERLRQLALVTGVDLDEEGLAALLPQIDRLFAGIVRLNELILAETEPATNLILKVDQ